MSDLPAPLAPLARLPAISLAALQEEAAFLTRRDRKYLLPLETAGALLAGLDPATRMLEIAGRRDFGYLSVYFDDAAQTSYLGAARRRPNRFKVRTRHYTDGDLRQLEVKVRDARGRTVKHRLAHDADPAHLTAAERRWLGEFPQVAPVAWCLRPCLTTRYRRLTLVLPAGAGRVTLDHDLHLALPDGRTCAISELAIIETKGAGGPTSLDRYLWRLGHRPVAISKFACGLSLLCPELPANRWHRVRTRLAAAAGLDVAPRLATAPADSPPVILTPSGGAPMPG